MEDTYLDFKEMSMKITRSVISASSATDVWRVLGGDYGSISDWASGVFSSSAKTGGSMPAGAHCAGRDCVTAMGPITETFESYDDSARTMVYTVEASKMPFFVKGIQSAWAVNETAKDGSRIEMVMTLKLMRPFNLLAGKMMEKQMGESMLSLLEDLKHVVENAEPHPRKVKELQDAS